MLMPEKFKSFPDVAVSSLSGSPADARKPWQVRFASHETANNLTELVQTLQTSFEGSDISVSLLPGRNINSKRTVKYLTAKEIRVSSIDVPDVVPFRQLVGSVSKSLREKDGRLANHLGWYISNTGSELQQRRKVKKALKATGAETVKTSAGLWRDGNQHQGEKLEALLEKYTKKSGKDSLSLVIEIDTGNQSPAEYLAFIKAKRQELIDRNSKLSVVMDVDLGHIAQWGIDSVAFLEEAMADPDAIAMVSFNQHIKGEAEAHAKLTEGVVNFEQAAHVMGRSAKEDAVVVFEPNPTQRESFTETLLGDFGQKLKNAFSNGRASKSD